jgi:hypothetical protein
MAETRVLGEGFGAPHESRVRSTRCANLKFSRSSRAISGSHANRADHISIVPSAIITRSRGGGGGALRAPRLTLMVNARQRCRHVATVLPWPLPDFR